MPVIVRCSFQASLLLAASLAVCCMPCWAADEPAPASSEGDCPVAVNLSPDQPLPHVYIDEPLVIELTASRDVEIFGKLELFRNGESLQVTDLGWVALRANSRHWLAVSDLPTARGRYEARIKIDVASGPSMETTASFCRVDRPVPGRNDLVGVAFAALDGKDVAAARGIPLKHVRVPAGAPDVAQRVAAAHTAGLQVLVAFEKETLSDAPAVAGNFARTLDDQVAGWEIVPQGAGDFFVPVATALRGPGSRAPLWLACQNTEDLAARLEESSSVDGVVCPGGEEPGANAFAYGMVAARNGIESPALAETVPLATDGGAALAKTIVRCAAAGTSRVMVPAELVYADGDFQAGYPYLAAFARQVGEKQYLGQLAAGQGIEAHLFRLGWDWVLVLWRTDEPQDVPLELGGAEGLSLTDALGNPIALSQPEGETLTFHVGLEPCFLTGRGGNVLLRVARAMACKQAAALISSEEFSAAMPETFVTIVQGVAAEATAKPDRLSFFGLLRMFPRIESDWRSGALSTETAVPAMAALTKLIRYLCVLEQEDGDPFMESLETTLAECDRNKSRYLTSAGPGGTPARGDWLLAEVNSLMAEARALDALGRNVEASGIATLAEWRARSLDAQRAGNGS